MTVNALDHRKPCPICDHPTGDCGPEGDHPSHVLFEEWGEGYRAPDERKTEMADIVATERIWENVPIPRTADRTRRVLRYRPGQVVPEDRAKALNVKADGTQSKVPTADDATGDAAVPIKKAAPVKKAAKKTTAKRAGKKATGRKAAAKKAR